MKAKIKLVSNICHIIKKTFQILKTWKVWRLGTEIFYPVFLRAAEAMSSRA